MKFVQRRQWSCAALALLMVLSLFIGTAQPAIAAETIQQRLELKVGSSTALINGEKITIEKPIVHNGITMVSLGVFKKAFGSQVRLEKGESVKLLQGAHTLTMTIDSRTGWVDGKKVILDTAPTMVSDTLMVPLRFVVEGIGAQMIEGAKGQLVITLNVKETANDQLEQDSMDVDLGKTRVGNSYYKWSINYPVGLLIGGSDENESGVYFSDSEGNYYLEIHALKQEGELTADELQQQLVTDAKNAGEIVLHRETFAEAATPYARIITKDMDGTLWELRQYYANDRLYEIYFADIYAENYKDFSKYATLLNSFKPGYNQFDRSVKDLSTIQDGLREVYADDYGVSLLVPAEWSRGNEADFYYGDGKGSYLSLNIYSAPERSSLTQWSNRLKKVIEESFVPEAYEWVDTYSIKAADKHALVNEVKLNLGDRWMREHQVLIQQNGYRYYLEYSVPEDALEDIARFKSILSGMDIDYTVLPENFGTIGEDNSLLDKSDMQLKTSRSYQYKITIPKYWTPVSARFEKPSIMYEFTGGEMVIEVDQDSSYTSTVNRLKAYYQQLAQIEPLVKVERVDNTTFAGQQATIFNFSDEENGIAYSAQVIVIRYNGMTYIVSVSMNDANATEVQKKVVEQVLQSFQFIKPINI